MLLCPLYESIFKPHIRELFLTPKDNRPNKFHDINSVVLLTKPFAILALV